jgi:contractile injection system tube protein
MDTDRTVLRGFIANIDVIPPLIVTFQFNPTSVSDNKAVTYVDRNRSLCSSPEKVYTGGGTRTITFDLKLDGLEVGTDALNPTAVDNGISTELAKFRSFLYPKADAWATVSGLLGGSAAQGKRLAAPPTCYFGFGTKVLECVVTDIKITETMFNSALAPVRADVTVTLAVVEYDNNTFYQFDTQHRNVLAALGLQNIRIV